MVAAGLLGYALPVRAIDGRADTVRGREPQSAPQDEIAYKFTPSFYRTTHATPAYDLNVRGNLGAHAAWIGFYQRADEFQQLRLGRSEERRVGKECA